MKASCLLLVVVAGALLASCKSNPIASTPTSSDRLEIKPDTLVGVPYVYYSFEARVDGVAQSDVFYTWDFGDGAKDSNATDLVGHTYFRSGTYTVVVSAFDQFADTLIATKQTLAIIRDSIRTITLSPSSGDTSILVDENGKFTVTNFLYSVTASSPTPNLTYIFHATGAGLDTVIHPSPTDPKRIQFVVNSPTTVKMVVTATDEKGNIFGMDSSVVNYKPQVLSMSILQNYKTVSAFLITPDSMKQQVNTNGILQIQLQNVSWNGASFNASNIQTNEQVFPHFQEVNDRFNGSLSSDVQTLQQFTVSVNDTSWGPSFTPVEWGYTLQGVRLYQITSSSVTYAFSAAAWQQVVSGLQYASPAYLPDQEVCGNLPSNYPNNIGGVSYKSVGGYVVFSN